MRRDTGVPFLILALLVGLSAGAAVLGFRQAPPAADLAVHNGAGETVAAPSLTAIYTSNTSREVIEIRYTAPDHATETLLHGGPAGKPLEVHHVTGPAALQLLSPVATLVKVTGFTKVGPTYQGSQPVSALVPKREARLVSGAVHYTVTVTSGYVVTVVEDVVITTPAGTQREGGTYRLVRIGDWRVPAG